MPHLTLRAGGASIEYWSRWSRARVAERLKKLRNRGITVRLIRPGRSWTVGSSTCVLVDQEDESDMSAE